MLNRFKVALIGTTSMAFIASGAYAHDFDIPRGDLKVALDAYMKQAGVALMYPPASVTGIRSPGARGELPAEVALAKILAGTGFSTQRTNSGAIGIVRDEPEARATVLAQVAPRAAASGVETVVVTSSKIKGDIQTVPIAITALSQEQLTSRQIAGGPDLVKEVPNLTFSKTNFTGYNIQIRGIGTQAISVTTDPAVAVAFNDTPFIRNHFFEQEFYDVGQVEVLRGPQGTLYGRNATAGVVNVISAKPTDQFEASLSADIGNYHNRRYEGMINIPVVDDRLDIRAAAEWTKRDGYTTDTTYNTPVDGRDLWSSRVTIGWKPASNVQTYLVWEHFQESDDRLRSAKQLCKTDNGPGSIDGHPKPLGIGANGPNTSAYGDPGDFFTQGCLPSVSLYSPQAYGAPYGYALPYVLGLEDLGTGLPINPYASTTQSTNLRQIESSILPTYRSKNDTLEYNATWAVTPSLTFDSDTGYNNDFLWSTEDFNRFGSTPGLFNADPVNLRHGIIPDPSGLHICTRSGDCGGASLGEPCTSGDQCEPAGYFVDPQLGGSDALIAEDLSTERAWQFSQEFRLASNFTGPLNFTAGGNYMHYETVEKYYVFSNALTLINANSPPPYGYPYDNPFQYDTPGVNDHLVTDGYIDPNPITNLNDQGHNYFLSKNPYVLNSYALFGEANYKIAPDLMLIGGLRWTDDQKHFLVIPSWVAIDGYGYPVTGTINQKWSKFTGRAVLQWSPKLDFTDQTMIYASAAHGYKAGGANPPGAEFTAEEFVGNVKTAISPVHPLTFNPEYIEAFEAGTKNTMLDGALTLNGDVFYYNYTGYQISEIVDRTAINTNFNAHVEGAELQADWEPLPGLKFNFAGGYEDARLNKGDRAVDLMDRTAGHPGWYVVKPFATEASNCIFPEYVAKWILFGAPFVGGDVSSYCSITYDLHLDPFTQLPYVANPTVAAGGGPPTDAYHGLLTDYPGFDPLAGTPGHPYTGQNTDPTTGIDYGPVPNNGQGFAKNLGGNQLPNAPHFTLSLAGEYTMPISENWAATFHTDFYWQSQQWARVFADPIDKIRPYSNVNLSLILTSASGWQVMGYVKNIFDTTAITGTFLNSDDTGLTTNAFLTDPRLYGIRITKSFDGGSGGGVDFFSNSDADGKKPQIWLTLGGEFDMLDDRQQKFTPLFFSAITAPLSAPTSLENPPRSGLDYDAKLEFEPEGSDWTFSAAIRYGRTSHGGHEHQQTPMATTFSFPAAHKYEHILYAHYLDAFASSKETHQIIDFTAGKDFGLGSLGNGDLDAGVRLVQFGQSSSFRIHTDPDYVFHELGPKYNHNYYAMEQAKRSFHGIGPSLSWDASTPVANSTPTNGFSIDWGVNAALLFGRQTARVHHLTTGVYHCRPFAMKYGTCDTSGMYAGGYRGAQFETRYQRSGPAKPIRHKEVVVPNLGGFAGISWKYDNAKISFGYRADEFFGAMDGGLDSRKSYNLGLFGPYANISIGFGG